MGILCSKSSYKSLEYRSSAFALTWQRLIHNRRIRVKSLSKILGEANLRSSTVAFREYKLMLRLAQRLLSNYSDIMLLAERGFGNHELVNWLQNSAWHYCLRLPCDVTLHGARRHPIELKYLYPPKSKAVFYQRVGLWLDGELS